VKEVRAAIAAGDFGKAQKSLMHATKDSGYLEAMSWMLAAPGGKLRQCRVLAAKAQAKCSIC
jgi:hypothetical protein